MKSIKSNFYDFCNKVPAMTGLFSIAGTFINIEHANQSVKQLSEKLGYKTANELFNHLPDLKNQILAECKRIQNSDQTSRFTFEFHSQNEPVFLTFKFNYFNILNNKNLIPAFVFHIEDTTENKRNIERIDLLENKINSLQKMNNISRVTSGLKHDLKNLFSLINGFSEMIFLKLRPESEEYDLMSHIISTNRQISDILKQISHADKYSNSKKLEEINLNDLIMNTISPLQRTYISNIKFITGFGNIYTISGVPGQLSRVLQNIIFNAADAMPQGGTICISTFNTKIAVRESGELTDCIRIDIEDTGSGMDKDVEMNIFNSFFTTKSEGTGLGLYEVKNIITEHGGEIKVSSKINEGTKFSITLPSSNQSKNDSTENEHGALKKVLLINSGEDNSSYIANSISRMNYSVECVSSMLDAISKLRSAEFYYQYLIFNDRINDITERDVIKEAKSHNNEIEFIFLNTDEEPMSPWNDSQIFSINREKSIKILSSLSNMP
ncbi:MAG: ATP-binding protein [Spirochaetia bacterium]|nr:ATP-binding protein [Spirochaetia bacterium]